MDVNLMTKALFNVICDSENGCMLDSLSVKVDNPVYDSGYGEFIQHILFSLDRIATPSEMGFLHRLEEEYKRLESECK